MSRVIMRVHVTTASRTRAPTGDQRQEDTPSRASGVTLRELMDKARRAGHPRLPTFVAVHLLRRLSTAVENAIGLPPGALTMDSVSLHFDGTFSLTGSAGAAEDTRALAALFEPLSLDTPPELALVIAAAARGELEQPRELARRLGHWAVKQQQLPGDMDLNVALLAWLFPGDVADEVTPELARYFESTRTAEPESEAAPVVEAPPVGAKHNAGWLFGTLALVAVTSTMLFLAHRSTPLFPHYGQADRDLPPMPPTVEARPAPIVIPEPALTRVGHGVPANVLLKPSVHGVDLTRAGFELKPEAPPLRARLTTAQGNRQLPKYAWLYVAEFDAAGRFSKLSTLGTKWAPFSAASVRFFLVQPDHPPESGSYDLEVQGGERHPNVFREAVTQQEGRRFILDQLDPEETYAVTLERPPSGTAPPVVVSATQPYNWVQGGVFPGNGPLLQALLSPGVPMKATHATRLSFVVLTTPETPDVQLTVKVQRWREQAADPALAMTHYQRGEEAFIKGDYAAAITALSQCQKLNPAATLCSDLLAQARRLSARNLK